MAPLLPNVWPYLSQQKTPCRFNAHGAIPIADTFLNTAECLHYPAPPDQADCFQSSCLAASKCLAVGTQVGLAPLTFDQPITGQSFRSASTLPVVCAEAETPEAFSRWNQSQENSES